MKISKRPMSERHGPHDQNKTPHDGFPLRHGVQSNQGSNRKENKHDTKIHDCQGGGPRLRTAVLHRTRAARPRDVQARGVRIPLAEDGLPSGAAIERMRDKCGEAGSSLDFDAGATIKAHALRRHRTHTPRLLWGVRSQESGGRSQELGVSG